MATLGTQGTRRRQIKKQTNKSKSKKTTHKITTVQYVLNISIRKQTQLTLIIPPTNNWWYKGTEHRDKHHDTDLRT